MVFYSAARVIKFAAQNIWRNLGLSFMTVSILVVTLLSVNVLITLNALTQHSVMLVKEKVDVSIFFKPEATPNQVQEIREYLSTFPQVQEVTLQSPEQVMQAFREKHGENSDVLISLDELAENPFGATITVRTAEAGHYQEVLAGLDTPDVDAIVESMTYDEHGDAISKLEDITSSISRLMIGVTALFALIAFLIIFNTIRVAIYTQREEISIKKLVGASNWFVRAPFFLDGVVYTLLSVGIAIGLLALLMRLLDGFTRVTLNNFSLVQLFKDSPMLFVYQIIGVLLLTWLSSALAMRKYLRS